MTEGLEREELLHQAESARERLAVLSEVSDVLMSSTDYLRTVPEAMRIAIPRIADWASVSYFDAGALVRDVAHRDGEMERRIRSFWKEIPTIPPGPPLPSMFSPRRNRCSFSR